MKQITIKDDLELKAYIDSLNENQLSSLLDLVRESLRDRINKIQKSDMNNKIQKSGNYNIAGKITFSLEDQFKAKQFIEILDGNSLTFIVYHMLREHSDVFLPMLTKLEVKI